MNRVHRFGRFELRPLERRILADGEPLACGARAFDVLQLLVERRGGLVTKAELLDHAWPGLMVEEANVHVQISGLRRLLGAETIATVPGLGYRLAAAFHDPAEVAPAAPPSAPTARHNLPASADPLIGRDADVAAVEAALGAGRLVSVLGPGGIGKSRVALGAAHRFAPRCAHGAWWVDLAALAGPEHLVAAVANAARVQLGSQEDESAALVAGLVGRELLLVLDNCEHLLEPVAALAAAILQRTEGVRLLATSQEPLRLPLERTHRLDPLDVPPTGAPLDAARRCSAWQLMEARARAVDRHFTLDARHAAAAIALLQRLDGLALAIEMAAARLPLLGVQALVDQLGERLGPGAALLRNTQRGVPARQQTLQAAVAWSHALLAPREQRLLRSLAVFGGSFEVDTALAAGAVAGPDGVEALDALVAKSLVQVVRGEPPRYRLLETLRAFAMQEVERLGELDAARRRHGQAMARVAERVEQAYWSVGDAAWLARHAPDYEDLQAAFDRGAALGSADPEALDVAALTGLALMRLDHLRNLHGPRGRRAQVLHRLLPHASPRARAWIWTVLASHGLLEVEGVSRVQAAHEAVAAWRLQDDRPALHFALGFLASELARTGEPEAAGRTLAEARRLEDPAWPARRLLWGASAAAGLCIHRGDGPGYREASRIELALAEQAGFTRTAAWARLKLADAALMAGDHDEAIELGYRAAETLRELDQPSNLGLALTNLCAALLLRDAPGDLATVPALAREALPLMWRNGWAYLLLDVLALFAARQGALRDAARLLGRAGAWYAGHGGTRQPNEHTLAQRALERLRRDLDAPSLDAAIDEGGRMGDAEAEALARLQLG